MLKMLVDTCVWLDMAKSPAQAKNLEILLNLRAEEDVDIIVPQIVLDEFQRNRDRVIAEHIKSINTTLSRAKEIVVQQGGKPRSILMPWTGLSRMRCWSPFTLTRSRRRSRWSCFRSLPARWRLHE